MRLLLDPLLAIPPSHPSGKLSSAPEFWNRIVDWAADKRVYVGQESYALIYEEYARHGYPDQSLEICESPARREYQSALNVLLARIQKHVTEGGERSFSPEYAGSEDQYLALQFDVSGTVATGIRGIATDPSHWVARPEVEIVVHPPPPRLLEVCYHPSAPLRAEESARIHTFFSGKRVHIVGGQIDQRIIRSICAHLGVESGDISWMACEKAKPPRDLDKRWRELDGERDITVCVTGRVGHSTSRAAARSAEKASTPHLLVELASGIEQALVDYGTQSG